MSTRYTGGKSNGSPSPEVDLDGDSLALLGLSIAHSRETLVVRDAQRSTRDS
jgi:hypothetical protein